MQLWAASILLRLGVPQHHITAIVLAVFADVKSRWHPFEASPGLLARTARRRWITELLLRRAAHTCREAAHPAQPPSDPPDLASAPALDSLPAGVPAADAPPCASGVLPRLEAGTTPRRWRIWLAREIDDLPIHEIARQEGCTPEQIHRLLPEARSDLRNAFLRETMSRT